MQGQGRAWLLQRKAAAGLRTVHLTDKHFRAILEVRGAVARTGSCLMRLCLRLAEGTMHMGTRPGVAACACCAKLADIRVAMCDVHGAGG